MIQSTEFVCMLAKMIGNKEKIHENTMKQLIIIERDSFQSHISNGPHFNYLAVMNIRFYSNKLVYGVTHLTNYILFSLLSFLLISLLLLCY